MVVPSQPITRAESLNLRFGVTMNTEEESSSRSWRDTMTDTRELDVINEALAIIDRGLGEMLHRELVSTDEVADLLLDVRTRLTQEEPAAN